MVKAFYKLTASNVIVLMLGACALTPTLEFPTGNRSARIPLNVQMLAPQQLQPQFALEDMHSIQAQPVAVVSTKAEAVQTPVADSYIARKILVQNETKVIEKLPVKTNAIPHNDAKNNAGGKETVLSAKTEVAESATSLIVDQPTTLSLATLLASSMTQTAMPALVAEDKDANSTLAASQPVAVASTVQQQKTLPASHDAETLPSPNEPILNPEPPPPPPELTWAGRQGQTLRGVITDWAKTATPSWHVDWTTDLDYPIAMDFDVSAVTFLDAVTRIFAPYQKAQRYFSLTQQPKQRVLIVEEEKF